MLFLEKLDRAVEKNNTLLCIGLDSEFEKLPRKLKNKKNAQFEFNKKIIDETRHLICAYKLNTAFYEANGLNGINNLKLTCDYIKNNFDIPIIIDAKRADIGNTNKGYAKFLFDYLNADGITLHPYLGYEALKPFLDRKDKTSFILCRTSNQGADEIQDLLINTDPLFLYLAKRVKENWNVNNNCGLVIGATYPNELRQVRKTVNEMVVLVPGIGAQGGDLEKTLENGLRADKKGLIISSSRGIIFAESPKYEAEKLRNEINKFR